MASAVQRSTDAPLGRWLTVLWGIVALIVGVLLVSRPAPTALFLVSVMALLWLAGGIMDILSVIMGRAGQRGRLRLVGGVVAIIAGLIILLGDPFVSTALVVLVQFYLVALAAIVNGVLNIVGRIQGRGGWGRVVLGIVQLVIGVFFLLNPCAGLLAFVPALGVVLAVGGLLTIAAAMVGRTEAARPA